MQMLLRSPLAQLTDLASVGRKLGLTPMVLPTPNAQPKSAQNRAREEAGSGGLMGAK
jgi:hypothetical protein